MGLTRPLRVTDVALYAWPSPVVTHGRDSPQVMSLSAKVERQQATINGQQATISASSATISAISAKVERQQATINGQQASISELSRLLDVTMASAAAASISAAERGAEGLPPSGSNGSGSDAAT